MLRRRRSLPALLLVVGLPDPAVAGPRWELVTREDGVRVSQREVPGRSLPVFKGEARLDAGIFEILAVLSDIGRYTEWVGGCVDSRELKRITDRRRVNYTRTKAPWPVWDRDVVMRSRVAVDYSQREVLIRFESTRSALMGEVEGVVRMPRLRGFYRLRAIDLGHTDVVYQVDADPGGSLPKWIVRLATRSLPLETLRGLLRQVVATRGQYEAHLEKMRREFRRDAPAEFRERLGPAGF